MRRSMSIWIAVLWLAAAGGMAGARDKTLVLVRDGKSDYRIVVPVSASAQEERAAQELQSFIKEISGAVLPIVTDDRPMAGREIILGRNRHLEHIDARVRFRKLGDEGFTIRTVGSRLVIAGGPERGTLYGVYTFLEDYLGCRWYSSTVSRIPKTPDITLGRIDDTQVPAMVYRELYYGEAHEPAFDSRMKLNAGYAFAEPWEIASGEISGNGWCHTFFSFLSPEKYFDSHPEYFALRDGKRQPTQLCLSNPDVLRIVVENLRSTMAANPGFKYWSVSQMDNGEYCTCEKCKAIDDREGSPAGSALEFVNKVAAAFPDKRISTLAYWYTMCPPKTVKPAGNVHIVYCTAGETRDPFPAYYESWAKIAPLRYNWYYAIPCHNIIAPWPNLRLLHPLIKDYVAHGVSGMFVEGSNETGSEFADLRIYLLAKLMWNPNCDTSALMDDFLSGYYGAAGPSIRKYIDAMYGSYVETHDALDGHDWCAHHANTFLAPAMLAKYDAIFDEAAKAVEDDPVLSLRVRAARMPLMHAQLQLRYGDVDTRIALAERLLYIAKRSNTRFFGDFGWRPTDEYMAEVLDGLRKERAEGQ